MSGAPAQLSQCTRNCKLASRLQSARHTEGARLEGDAGRDDEGPVSDPLLKHEVVAAITVAHAQP